MTKAFEAVKARATLLAALNALLLILMGLGKVTQEQTDLFVESVGKIFDYGVMIFGVCALMLPSLRQVWKKLKGE